MLAEEADGNVGEDAAAAPSSVPTRLPTETQTSGSREETSDESVALDVATSGSDDEHSSTAKPTPGADAQPQSVHRGLPLFADGDGVSGTTAVLSVRAAAQHCDEGTPRGWAYLATFAAVSLAVLTGIGFADYDTDGDGVYFGCNGNYYSNASRVDSYCGVDALDCRPLETSWFVGRCPNRCLEQWPSPVLGGDGFYVGTSRICASAIHAGVIDNKRGGCFGIRLAGSRDSFPGSSANDVVSLPFGWFPRAVQFRALGDDDNDDNGDPLGAPENCNKTRPWMDAYCFVAAALLLLLLRPSARFAFYYVAALGVVYLTTATVSNQNFWVLLNGLSPEWAITAMICVLLWPVVGPGTLPAPRRFPLDALVFYYLPFWLGVRMEVVENLGITISFSSDAFDSTESIIGFVLFIIIGGALLVLQARLWHKAGKLRRVVLTVVCVLLAVVVVILASSDWLTLHLHHWMVGVAGLLLFQGQPRWRAPIIVNGLCLGVLVNGLIVWGLAPLFDQGSGPSSGGSGPGGSVIWSGVNVSSSEVALEFTSQETVMDVWNCSHAGYAAAFPSLQADTDTSLSGPASLDPIATADAGTAGASAASGPVPLDNATLVGLSMNAVLLVEQYEATAEAYAYSAEDLPPSSLFQFAAAIDGLSSTPYLTVRTLAEGEPAEIGGGFYDGTNATFADPCQRVYALLQATAT